MATEHSDERPDGGIKQSKVTEPEGFVWLCLAVAPSKNFPSASTNISHRFLATFSPSALYPPCNPWQGVCSNPSFPTPQTPSH